MIHYLTFMLLFIILSCESSTKDKSRTQLIDLEKSVPHLKLDVKYATTNNFTHQIVYDTVRVFLVKPAAEALKQVAIDLKEKNLGILLFDAYRPLSVQKKFWEIYPDPNYVADPQNGSRHNRGAAIDLSLYNLESGIPLEMPTDFDNFTEQAHHSYQDLSEEVILNRMILKTTMEKNGFIALDSEWWHYDFENWKSYPVLDLEFGQIDQKLK